MALSQVTLDWSPEHTSSCLLKDLYIPCFLPWVLIYLFIWRVFAIYFTQCKMFHFLFAFPESDWFVYFIVHFVSIVTQTLSKYCGRQNESDHEQETLRDPKPLELRCREEHWGHRLELDFGQRGNNLDFSMCVYFLLRKICLPLSGACGTWFQRRLWLYINVANVYEEKSKKLWKWTSNHFCLFPNWLLSLIE